MELAVKEGLHNPPSQKTTKCADSICNACPIYWKWVLGQFSGAIKKKKNYINYKSALSWVQIYARCVWRHVTGSAGQAVCPASMHDSRKLKGRQGLSTRVDRLGWDKPRTQYPHEADKYYFSCLLQKDSGMEMNTTKSNVACRHTCCVQRGWCCMYTEWKCQH